MPRGLDTNQHMQSHIAFLGAGNMASAMINGLLTTGFSPLQLRAADPSEEALEAAAEAVVGSSQLAAREDLVGERLAAVAATAAKAAAMMGDRRVAVTLACCTKRGQTGIGHHPELE